MIRANDRVSVRTVTLTSLSAFAKFLGALASFCYVHIGSNALLSFSALAMGPNIGLYSHASVVPRNIAHRTYQRNKFDTDSIHSASSWRRLGRDTPSFLKIAEEFIKNRESLRNKRR